MSNRNYHADFHEALSTVAFRVSAQDAVLRNKSHNRTYQRLKSLVKETSDSSWISIENESSFMSTILNLVPKCLQDLWHKTLLALSKGNGMLIVRHTLGDADPYPRMTCHAAVDEYLETSPFTEEIKSDVLQSIIFFSTDSMGFDVYAETTRSRTSKYSDHIWHEIWFEISDVIFFQSIDHVIQGLDWSARDKLKLSWHDAKSLDFLRESFLDECDYRGSVRQDLSVEGDLLGSTNWDLFLTTS